MQVINRIAVLALLASRPVFAEPPSKPAPAVMEHSPAPTELAPLSQDIQAAMANSQLQTYRYNQLTEQALALKKLCETGFGPIDVCPKTSSSGPQGASEAKLAELPTIAEIDGAGGDLTAVMVLGDGRRLTVSPGSTLPDGSTVIAITGDGVRIKTALDREERLAFGGGQAR